MATGTMVATTAMATAVATGAGVVVRTAAAGGIRGARAGMMRAGAGTRAGMLSRCCTRQRVGSRCPSVSTMWLSRLSGGVGTAALHRWMKPRLRDVLPPLYTRRRLGCLLLTKSCVEAVAMFLL